MIEDKELNKLYRYAMALTHKSDLAYDLVHEAVLKIQGKIVLNKVAYLKTCVRNSYFDHLKFQKKEITNSTDTDHIVTEVSSLDLEKVYISLNKVNTVFGQLDSTERELIYLRYVEDYTYKEISKYLGLKIGTVMSRIHRCKIKIQKIGGAC